MVTFSLPDPFGTVFVDLQLQTSSSCVLILTELVVHEESKNRVYYAED